MQIMQRAQLNGTLLVRVLFSINTHQYFFFFFASTWKRVLSSTQLLCTMNTLVRDETCTSVICLKQGHCLHYRKDDSLIIKEERVFPPLSRIWNIPGTSQYPKKTPVQTIQEFIKMDTSWGSPGVCIGAVPYSTNIRNFGESQTIWIKVRHFTYGTATSGTFKVCFLREDDIKPENWQYAKWCAIDISHLRRRVFHLAIEN